jgi:sulfonate transport system substrate-binding protein
MKKKLFATVTILMLAFTLFACGGTSEDSSEVGEGNEETVSSDVSDDSGVTEETVVESDSNDAQELTISVGDQAAFFLFKIAEEKGFFEEEFGKDNITIKSEIFAKMGPAIIEAMGAGDVDLSIVGIFPVVNANNSGNEITILASGNYTADGFRLVVGPESDITSVDQLSGKKIGVASGTAEHMIVLQLLQKYNITDQVELVNLSQADALTALLSGDIDAALFNSGTLSEAENAGAKTIATNEETGLVVNPVIGRKEFVEEHPEITSRFLKVLDKTAKWIDENEDETVKIAAEVIGADEESVRVSLLARGRKISIDDEYLVTPVQSTLDFAKEQGLIDENLKYEDIVDTSYFENAGIEE